MASILDIVQSVIVAGIIALMVLGVHMMTLRSSTENQVMQQLQGVADLAVTIIQEEIRHLHSFVSDSVRVNTNSIYFRDPDGTIVFMEAEDDSLFILKLTKGSELLTGTVSAVLSSNSVMVTGNPAISAGSLVMLVSPLSQGETKIVKNYSSAQQRLTIRGEWDMTFSANPGPLNFHIYQTTQLDSRTYHLRLVDRSDDEIYVFNMVEWGSGGEPVNTSDTVKDMKNIYLIRVNITVGSSPDQLYSSCENEQFYTELQKEFFLRGYRLPSPGG
jgi:hypothetical protein